MQVLEITENVRSISKCCSLMIGWCQSVYITPSIEVLKFSHNFPCGGISIKCQFYLSFMNFNLLMNLHLLMYFQNKLSAI